MPAEWEPHEATWIAWPHHRDDWPGKFAPVPVGLRRDRPPSQPGRDRRHPGRGRHDEAAVADHAGPAREWTWSGCSSSRRDRPRLAPQLRPDLRGRDEDGSASAEEAPPGPSRLIDWKFNAWAKYDDHCTTSASRGGSRHSSACTAGCRGSSRGKPRPGRAGRRRDRRQRPGYPDDHRGVPAERGPGAATRASTGEAGAGLRRLPRACAM